MANIVRYDPFAELDALQKQFFGDDWLGATASTAQLPATDVYIEGDKQMVVEAHLPNFDDRDVSVSVDNGYLEIQAEKHQTEKDKKKKYVVRETSSSFYRRVLLPEHADAGKIDAHIKDGVLKVVVPYKKLPAPKKIPIAIGKGKK